MALVNEATAVIVRRAGAAEARINAFAASSNRFGHGFSLQEFYEAFSLRTGPSRTIDGLLVSYRPLGDYARATGLCKTCRRRVRGSAEVRCDRRGRRGAEASAPPAPSRHRKNRGTDENENEATIFIVSVRRFFAYCAGHTPTALARREPRAIASPGASGRKVVPVKMRSTSRER